MGIPFALAARVTQSIEPHQMFYDAMLGLEVQQEALDSKPSSPTNLLPQ
jgi:hypothetical protein